MADPISSLTTTQPQNEHQQSQSSVHIPASYTSATWRVSIIGYDCVNQPNPYVEYLLQVNNIYPSKDTSSSSHTTNPSVVTWYLRRRYREFRELHDLLKDSYPFDILPPFPPKRFFANLSSSFLLQRRQELQLYIDRILVLDPTVQSPTLHTFLTVGQIFMPSPLSSSNSSFSYAFPRPSLSSSVSSRSLHQTTAATLSLEAIPALTSSTNVEDEAIATGCLSPLGALSPTFEVPPAPPSSPNIQSPMSQTNPNDPDSQRYPHSSWTSNLRLQEDIFLQKTKDRLLDLSDLDENSLDAMDLETRAQLYRAVLVGPGTLEAVPKQIRLPDVDNEVGESSGDSEIPLMLRPIPQHLWDKLQMKQQQNPSCHSGIDNNKTQKQQESSGEGLVTEHELEKSPSQLISSAEESDVAALAEKAKAVRAFF